MLYFGEGLYGEVLCSFENLGDILLGASEPFSQSRLGELLLLHIGKQQHCDTLREPQPALVVLAPLCLFVPFGGRSTLMGLQVLECCFLHGDLSFLFDSSGESLHHRGYRKQVDKAPMNEVLAAGLIQLSGWKADCNFLDCMCGSGTLPIEAAMYAMKIPAGYYRKQWGFMKWDDWDPELWQRIKDEADSQICDFDYEIWASDRSPKAVAIAENNINYAHLQHDIHLMKKNMEDLTPPEGGGIVIINPPYGDRLEEDDIDSVYENIGNTLKHNFQGFRCWLITDDAVALKHIGLKPSEKIPVWNGPLECRFVCFDIFEGKYKEMKAKEAKDDIV